MYSHIVLLYMSKNFLINLVKQLKPTKTDLGKINCCKPGPTE